MNNWRVQVDDAKQVLRFLCDAYPTYPVNEATAGLYIEVLVRFDAEHTAKAMQAWVTQQRQFPRLADVIDAARAETRRHSMPRLAIVERPPVTDAGRRIAADAIRKLRPLTRGETHEHDTAGGSRTDTG